MLQPHCTLSFGKNHVVSCVKISPLTGRFLALGFESGEVMIINVEKIKMYRGGSEAMTNVDAGDIGSGEENLTRNGLEKNPEHTIFLDNDVLNQLRQSISLIREQQHAQNVHNNEQERELPPSFVCTTIGTEPLRTDIIQQFPFIEQYFLAHRHGGINCMDWSWNEAYLATCGNDKTIRVFEAATSKTLKILHGHYNIVYSIKFSPTGSMIASASFDETVRIWSTLSGECLRSLSAHTDPVTSIDFSHDGSIIMSCGFDGHVRLWDSSTGQCLKSFVSSQLLRNPPVASARFSPNSKYCAGLLFDGCVRLWNCDTTQISSSLQQNIDEEHVVGTGGAIRVYVDSHRMSGKYLTNLEWFLPEEISSDVNNLHGGVNSEGEDAMTDAPPNSTNNDAETNRISGNSVSGTPRSRLTCIAVPSEPLSNGSHYMNSGLLHRPNYVPKDTPLERPSIVLYDVQTKQVIQKAYTKNHQSTITFISANKNDLYSADQDGNVVFWSWKPSE